MKGDVSHRLKTAKIVLRLNYHELNFTVNCTICPSAQLLLAVRLLQYWVTRTVRESSGRSFASFCLIAHFVPKYWYFIAVADARHYSKFRDFCTNSWNSGLPLLLQKITSLPIISSVGNFHLSVRILQLFAPPPTNFLVPIDDVSCRWLFAVWLVLGSRWC